MKQILIVVNFNIFSGQIKSIKKWEFRRELDYLSILFPWFPVLPNLKSVALAQYILLCVNINSYSSKLNSLKKNIDTNERFQGSIRFNTTKFKGSFGMLSVSEHQ